MIDLIMKKVATHWIGVKLFLLLHRPVLSFSEGSFLNDINHYGMAKYLDNRLPEIYTDVKRIRLGTRIIYNGNCIKYI